MMKSIFGKVVVCSIVILFVGTTVVPALQNQSSQKGITRDPLSDLTRQNPFLNGLRKSDEPASQTTRNCPVTSKNTPDRNHQILETSKESSERGHIAYAYCVYDPSGQIPSGFVTFDLDDPSTMESIGGGGVGFMSGADFLNDHIMYACGYYGGLYMIDFENLTEVFIASTIPLNGLTYDSAIQTWYCCDTSNLYIIDISSGATTTVGPLGALNTIIGLACDKEGNMYGYDVLFTGMSSLYSINTTTGAATVIGSMGVGFLYAQDPAYDRDDGILYLAGYTQSGTSGLYTCNVDTGAASLVGGFPGNAEIDAFGVPWQLFQYDHDINVQSIIAPISQNAAPITPIVKVKNVGNNTEYDVPINLLIGKELITGAVEDFEADNGSYIHAAKNTDNWQWGAPTSGPMGAHSGSNVWATVLNGPYPNSMWTLLMTPEFTVPSGAAFNYWQWYEFESGWDGGNVKISTDGGTTFNLITPEGGYPGVLSSNPYMTGQPGFTGTGGTSWKQVNFDLSAYEGMNAIILWEAASDSSVTYAGWYIDDVGFTITSWVNEYNQTITIPLIIQNELINVTYPPWTPVDLGFIENSNISYKTEATNMFLDDNAQNDYKSKLFILHYGYFNDVALTEITSPISGPATPQTPKVVIQDHGQNDENVNVNMVIGKAVYTTLLEEDFAGGVPPPGWGTNYPSNWISSNTNYAGGTAPEAQFYYSPSSVGEHLLYTMPIDTTGYTALLLKFKEYVNDYNGLYSLKIQTSTDGGATWSDAYVRAGGPYGPATTQVSLSAANGVGSDNFMIAWDMSGDSYNINYWYIDDVWLGLIDLVPEYDETVIVDINAGQTMNVTLPEWTPSDLPFGTTFDYLIDASASMNISDGNPTDNELTKVITLSFEHDVGITDAFLDPAGPLRGDPLRFTWNHMIGFEPYNPPDHISNGTYTVLGIVKNFGVSFPENNITIDARITNLDNSTVIYHHELVFSDVLIPGETALVTFPNVTFYPDESWEGNYKLEIMTMLPGDDHPNNDKKTLTFYVDYNHHHIVTYCYINGIMGLNGWFVSKVIITLDPWQYPGDKNLVTSEKWPTGINHTYYKIDDAANWTEYIQPFNFSEDGRHIIYYYSVDKCIPPCIEDVKSTPFRIDKTEPSITMAVEKIGFRQWKFIANVSDATSGVSFVEFYLDDMYLGKIIAPGPYEWNWTGHGNHSIRGVVYDTAGLSTTSNVVYDQAFNQYNTQGYSFKTIRVTIIQFFLRILTILHHVRGY